MTREEKIEKICTDVLDNFILPGIHKYDPDECIFCERPNPQHSTEDNAHEDDCTVLIAKQLLTKQ